MIAARNLFGAMTLALVLAGCGRSSADAPKKDAPPQTVTVAPVAERELAGTLRASGRLLPREEAAVALDVGGFRVLRVMVEEGARVRRGQVLATLDGSLLRPQIAQLQATLTQQTVAAEQARDQASRVSGLENQGVISNEAIAGRRFAARSSQAAVAATRAQLQEAMTRLSRLEIRAPVDGIVLERTVRPGDTPSPGANLFRIARDSLIELYAELPEASVAGIAPGDPVDVALPSGRILAGNVRLIGARVDGQSGLVTVRIGLPRDGELRQGGFAEARFMRPTRVLAVPESAVQFDADGASVKVVGKDNRVHRIAVRTGQRAGGLVELRSGPPPGSRVAVKGSAFTLEGDVVRVAGSHAR